jgi:hypothetical protein
MLTLFSPGLPLTSLVFDIVYPIMDNDRFLGGRWVAAFWIAAGVIGGWPRRCSA